MHRMQVSFGCVGRSSFLRDAIRNFTNGTNPCLAKKVVPFTYVRTKKKPSIFDSGDKEEFPTVDATRPTLEFADCERLKDASPLVKRLVSLEFAPMKETVRVVQADVWKQVRQHCVDDSSFESQIAKLTVAIRRGQQHMRDNAQDKKHKVYLKESIDRRQKLMKFLRRSDYEKFEWLMDVLNIMYRPPPLFYHWTTRKGTLRNMTRDHCVALRKAKIDAYRAKLKAQQADFLDEKEKALDWIERESDRLKLTPEELEEIERRQMPFKIPVFPKHLSHKKLIPKHLIKSYPPD